MHDDDRRDLETKLASIAGHLEDARKLLGEVRVAAASPDVSPILILRDLALLSNFVHRASWASDRLERDVLEGIAFG